MKTRLAQAIIPVMLLLVLHLPANAQEWLKATDDFTIFQDNGTTPIFIMKVPASAFVDNNDEFTICKATATSLPVLISYEVDDAPGYNVPASNKGDTVDLFSYALLIKPHTIMGDHYELRNISTIPLRRHYAGCQAMLVKADYTYTDPVGGAVERGAIKVYFIAVTATSQVNADPHTVVARITFKLKEKDGADFKDFDDQIMHAMTHAGE